MQLHTKILLGLMLGAVVGVLANVFAGGAGWLEWINDYIAGPVGQIFLRLLFMVVIPLVFATLSLGVASLGDLRSLGRVGGRTFAVFLTMTAVAVVFGLTLTNVIRPGDGIPDEVARQLVETYRGQATERYEASGATDFGVNTFVEIVPRNPLRSAVEMEMLPVIFFSIMFGVALALIAPPRAAPVVRVLEGLADAVIKLVELAMKVAPFGVFALIFVVTSRFGWDLLGNLGWYVLVVLLGLALHLAVSFSVVLRFGAGLAPLRFWKAIRAALATAFSTSSSSATLPTSLFVADRRLGVPPKIASFVLPLGATMNMNGTALFEGATVLFVAQVFGIDLTIVDQIVVLLLAVLTAVGAAGVPGGSIPLLMVMAASVGVPPEGIAMIIGVDRLLDMCRTVVNVSGDLMTSCVVARMEGVWSPASMPTAEAAEADGAPLAR